MFRLADTPIAATVTFAKLPPLMKRDPICPLGLALYFATRVFAQTAAPLAIVDVNLVDVVRGETRGHQTVVISDGRIAGAGSSDKVSIPAQALRIPGQGRILSPASGICTSICAAVRPSPTFLWWTRIPPCSICFSRMAWLACGKWAVRTRGEPHVEAPAIKAELQRAAGFPVANIRSMDEIISVSTARQDFSLALMTIFGSSALLLAAIGIYGLMAYSVEQRTQEVGIRMALGAGTGAVRSMIVLQGMRPALAGVVIGVPVALGFTRLLTGSLYGVKPLDPLVFASAPLFLCLRALAAVWIPARRASRIDPAEALRRE